MKKNILRNQPKKAALDSFRTAFRSSLNGQQLQVATPPDSPAWVIAGAAVGAVGLVGGGIKGRSPVARQIRTASIVGFFLAVALLLAACAAPFEAIIQDDLPSESPRGYLEFYCTECIAGWGVFRIENGEEVVVGQQPLGKKIAASMQAPARMKRLRIAQRPGSHRYVIRLMPYAFWEGDNSIRIHIRVAENELTPVRIEFDPWIATLEWRLLAGSSIPLAVKPESLEVLAAGLNQSEWETRWYSVQLLGEFKGALPEMILSRLGELSSDEAYRQCRKTETSIGCSDLREQAIHTIKKIKTAQPAELNPSQ